MMDPHDPFYAGPQQQRPAYHRVSYFLRARRSRGTFALISLFILGILLLWKLTSEQSPSTTSFLHDLQLPSASKNFFPYYHESSKSSSNRSEGFSKPSEAAKVFHLLIPATNSNDKLCKTIFSSVVLNYPPPTLVNFNKTFEDGNSSNGSHVGKIRGVLSYLSDRDQVRDNDIVLVIDGYDAWFQLPPEIVMRRYRRAILKANARNQLLYGFEEHNTSNSSAAPTKRPPKFEQSIMFGADKGCWPNPLDSPACSRIPPSPLPADSWGPDTDQHPQAWYNRPKYLNSGTIIGKASALRLLYERAAHKVDVEGSGEYGDQGVFAEIFGEQEIMREEYRKTHRSSTKAWIEWLKGKFGPKQRDPTDSIDRSLNQTTVKANWTAAPGWNYEFGIGLDYEMSMFQAVSMAWDDLSFVQYADHASIEETKTKQPDLPHPALQMPEDISLLRGPYALESTINNTFTPLSTNLDILPALNTSWSDCPLATNLRVPSIPVVLHFNGFKEFLDEWWPKMWYHGYSRALLRRYIRTPPDLSTWDYRGGKGGIWTTERTFFTWGDICSGYEKEIFGDGKGTWGKEEGPVKLYNSFGKLISSGEEGE